VQGGPGDSCTVLDVSLDVNRAGLLALLAAGVSVRYFDHHFAGEIPQHPRLEAHLDADAKVCTSILVDRHLGGRFRPWAAVGAFGDSLVEQGRRLSQEAGLTPEAASRLAELGVAINYNDYGESIADLHVPPVDLAAEMLRFADPLQFAATSATFHRLAQGFREDMEQAKRLEPACQRPGRLCTNCRTQPGRVAAAAPSPMTWPRRTRETPSPSSRKRPAAAIWFPCACPANPRYRPRSFCRRYPTGGGRRTAAGINHLPAGELEAFKTAFEQQFRVS